MYEVCKYKLFVKKEENFKFNDSIIKKPENAVKIFNHEKGLNMKNKPQEIFGMITLGMKKNIMGIMEISRGSLDSTIIHPRDIFQRAYLHNAAGIILGHNHPSGFPEPSEIDIKITEEIIEVSEILKIDVFDHIIIGDDSFYSMKAQEDI